MKIQTLEEFKTFAVQHDIPLEQLRFALGEDKGSEPMWFYIYQDDVTGEWVVAKNKRDGTKAVRYRGYDEAAACQILYDKLKEIRDDYAGPERVSVQHCHESYEPRLRRSRGRLVCRGILGGIISALMPFLFSWSVVLLLIFVLEKTPVGNTLHAPETGYYTIYNNSSVLTDLINIYGDLLYCYDSAWFYFDDDLNEWVMDENGVLSQDYYDYYDDFSSAGLYYELINDEWTDGLYDFTDTDYYATYSDDYDYDSNDDWNSYDWDDYDYNDYDWDSDW